jgi:hypothetical protein
MVHLRHGTLEFAPGLLASFAMSVERWGPRKVRVSAMHANYLCIFVARGITTESKQMVGIAKVANVHYMCWRLPCFTPFAHRKYVDSFQVRILNSIILLLLSLVFQEGRNKATCRWQGLSCTCLLARITHFCLRFQEVFRGAQCCAALSGVHTYPQSS